MAKLRWTKRGLAMLLAILLIMPQPLAVVATEQQVSENNVADVSSTEPLEEDSETDVEEPEEPSGTDEEKSEDTSGTEVEEPGETDIEEPGEPSEMNVEEAEREEDSDSVSYHTGFSEGEVHVKQDGVDRRAEGTEYFQEDGSYTIEIPEENPFFPYEVQFTYRGEITKEWFMTPDDTVTIGGHTFSVHAVFNDDTAITQMSFEVAGQTVIVYPEEKDFSGMASYSLEDGIYKADFTSYTPLELTRVVIQNIFTESKINLETTGKVAWTRKEGDNDYHFNKADEPIDLSKNYYYKKDENTYGTMLEVTIGGTDQPSPGNTHYRIFLQTTPTGKWLKPTMIYKKNSKGGCEDIKPRGYYYYNSYMEQQKFYIWLEPTEAKTEEIYISLDVDLSCNEAFKDKTSDSFDGVKVYDGKLASEADISNEKEITNIIFRNTDTNPARVYLLKRWPHQYITLVKYDEGEVTGFMPLEIYYYTSGNYISGYDKLKDLSGNDVTQRYETIPETCGNKTITKITHTLYNGYGKDKTYKVQMDYNEYGIIGNEKESFEGFKPADITAAFAAKAGKVYDNIEEARKDEGLEICKEVTKQVTESNSSAIEYEANYSEGVTFSIFVGNDDPKNPDSENDTPRQEKYYYTIVAKDGEVEKPLLGSDTDIVFEDLKDVSGNIISYRVNPERDSYADYNYLTFLVGEGTDLTKIAPVFDGAKYNVWVGENTTSGTLVESEKTFQDFSNGPVQYTVTSKNGKEQRNYWIQVVKSTAETDPEGKLYINSLKDENAKTTFENGITKSTRKIMIDSYHNNVHDILLVNKRETPITDLKVDLSSNDTVQLNNDYLTLSGGKLEGFTGIEANNFARIQLKKADGATDGSEIKGTLTIKSGDVVLMELTLTGMIGDPTITTTEIPEAVKYVPYGVQIRNNNNKYSWNHASYTLNGYLPPGMELTETGELYGVPKAVGDYTFTITINNSSTKFNDSSKTYKLVVKDNVDDNVDGATDAGYVLSGVPRNIDINETGEQSILLDGELGEFKDIYLDGDKLTLGTDYEKESDGTKITILAEKLTSKGLGMHTLGLEFREASADGSDYKELKRASQNYHVTESGGDGESSGGDGESSGGNGESSGGNGESSGGNGESSGGSGGDSGGNGSGGGGSSNNNNNTAASNKESTITPVAPDDSTRQTEQDDGGAKTVSYIVQPGDTLSKIAKKFYGRSEDWKKIMEANAGIITNPNKIWAGQVLTIRLAQDNSIITVPDDTGNGKVNYYTVQPGDTLYKIAKQFYGNGKLWRKIYQDNKTTISNPDRIRVGQVIIVGGIFS